MSAQLRQLNRGKKIQADRSLVLWFLLHKYLKKNFQIHSDTDIILVEKGNNQFISVTKSKQKYIDCEFMV